jgi:hypothetical protein
MTLFHLIAGWLGGVFGSTPAVASVPGSASSSITAYGASTSITLYGASTAITVYGASSEVQP